jgi:hypothetical protein
MTSGSGTSAGTPVDRLHELAPVIATGTCGVSAEAPDQRRQRLQVRTEPGDRRPDGRDRPAIEQLHVMDRV